MSGNCPPTGSVHKDAKRLTCVIFATECACCFLCRNALAFGYIGIFTETTHELSGVLSVSLPVLRSGVFSRKPIVTGVSRP